MTTSGRGTRNPDRADWPLPRGRTALRDLAAWHERRATEIAALSAFGDDDWAAQDHMAKARACGEKGAR